MEIFCGITPGLEPALEQEVRELAARPVERVTGGVVLHGDLVDAAGLCLWSRCAGQVLVRVGTVPAASLQQLEQEVRKLPWKEVLQPGPVKVKASLHGARFKRTDAAAHKVEQALRAVLGGGGRRGRPQEVLLRVEGRTATLSLDAGGRLHKRGYRQQTWRAPLRENLAAAVLWLADWSPDEPLLDPMCGAGTFGIEAALWEQAPGAGSTPACVDWPAFPRGVWRQLSDEAQAVRAEPGQIWSSDRARGALEAAEGNARRAGVLDALHLRHLDLRELEPPADPGLVVVNPPYGKRVSDLKKLHTLYGSLGASLRERLSGWRLAVVCPDKALAGRLLPRMEEAARFRNGGLGVTLFVGELP